MNYEHAQEDKLVPQENLPGVLGLQGGPMLRWSPRGSPHLVDGASSRPVGPLTSLYKDLGSPAGKFQIDLW